MRTEQQTLGGTDLVPTPEEIQAHFRAEVRRYKPEGQRPTGWDFVEARKETRQWLRQYLNGDLRQTDKMLRKALPVSEDEALLVGGRHVEGNIEFFARGINELSEPEYAREHAAAWQAWFEAKRGDDEVIGELESAARLLLAMADRLRYGTVVESSDHDNDE